MWRILWLPLLVILFPAVPAAALGSGLAAAQAQAPDARTITAKDLEPQTDWYGLYLKGKKMGYCRTTREKVDGGVRESFTLVMKLVSFGQRSELSLTQSVTFESKPPYRLLKGSFVQSENGVAKVSMELERAGDGFTITHVSGDVTRTKKHGPIDYTFLDSTATERWVRRRPKPGDQLASKDFNMQELKLEPQTSKVKDEKTSLAGGVKVHYYEIESESRQLTMLSRYDDHGRMLSGKFAIFDIRLEPEEHAKNAEFSQDLFILGMVKVDRALGPTRDVRELVVEVSGLDGTAFENGPRQAFHAPDNSKGDGKGPALLKLGKKYGRPAKVTDKEIEDNLRETLTCPITHPKIKELAAEAVGDAKTPADKVKRIVEFVHDYVEPSLSASLPNIHDLIRRKKGDCKSYALLTTTLARAAGVPSREVSGLLYIGDDNKAFGGHAWNEVVLDGVWVPVDASMGQTEVDATHISFGSQERGAKGMLETLGRLSFKLVEVKTGQP
ncbi:MAG: transglutaminase-like domain-containing protein [Gemmataceae bacterium]|nr:transglutaminase-like domain-containing protein [Gemmataceae bacterium]